MISTSRKLEIAAAAVGVALLCWIVTAYVGERENRIRAEITAQVAQEKSKAAQVDAQAIEQRIAQHDEQFKQLAETMQRQIDSISNIQQARAVLQERSTAAGTGALAPQVAKADLPAVVQQQLPNAPSATKYTLVTDEQMIAQAKFDKACDLTAANLTHCQADTGDLNAQVADEKTAIAAEKQRGDAWEKAAKGGTKLQRFVRAAKWAAIFGAIGYAAGRSGR